MNAHLPLTALIGFGEAGCTFARAGGWGSGACAYDTDMQCRSAMEECGVTACENPADALAQREIVLSLVTADSAHAVVKDYSPFLSPGAIWCDMNSVSPGTKREAAHIVTEAGGRYVDVAVMAPVQPAALDVPLLLSGDASQDAMEALQALGFANMRIVGQEVGRASAIKMVRSFMVKGLEALSYECAEAARAAGVLDEVTASLDASEKPLPWADRFAYNRERMETHGARRAAEMEEAAKTLLDLGIEPVMTRGTVVLQRRTAATKN